MKILVLNATLIVAIGTAWGQVDVSSGLETIRTNRHMPGISGMAIKQGHIVAQGAAGFRRQGTNTPFLVSDPVDIGSCTKWMTATIAGRLSVEDPGGNLAEEVLEVDVVKFVDSAQ